MKTVLIIIHAIISLALVIVVLLQHGKQQGLSGAIAGGAETFFGKNKGRTIDAMLKKFTSVIAALFIISSLALALVAVGGKDTTDVIPEQSQEAQLTQDEKGNLVDKDGNIIITADQLNEAVANETPAE